MLTKDLTNNIDVLREVMGQAPRAAQMRARATGKLIEKHVIDLLRGNQDPAITLGIMLSLHLLTNNVIDQMDKQGAGEGSLIQLLS